MSSVSQGGSRHRLGACAIAVVAWLLASSLHAQYGYGKGAGFADESPFRAASCDKIVREQVCPGWQDRQIADQQACAQIHPAGSAELAACYQAAGAKVAACDAEATRCYEARYGKNPLAAAQSPGYCCELGSVNRGALINACKAGKYGSHPDPGCLPTITEAVDVQWSHRKSGVWPEQCKDKAFPLPVGCGPSGGFYCDYYWSHGSKHSTALDRTKPLGETNPIVESRADHPAGLHQASHGFHRCVLWHRNDYNGPPLPTPPEPTPPTAPCGDGRCDWAAGEEFVCPADCAGKTPPTPPEEPPPAPQPCPPQTECPPVSKPPCPTAKDMEHARLASTWGPSILADAPKRLRLDNLYAFMVRLDTYCRLGNVQ